jgi:hypothetical protein
MSSPAEPGYFFIIGAMKAGTTSLFKYLADHPDLCPSVRKEPRIFRHAGDARTQRAALTALFERRKGERWCFEASTAYTKYPLFTGVPERIHAAVPDARLVYLVRNPVERTWSQYVHNLAHGRETLPFAEAIARRPQYLNVSRYELQLQQYYRVFPRERLLVLVFEEMVTDPTSAVQQLCRFLGVDSGYVPPQRERAFNASSSKTIANAPLRVLRQFGVDRVLPGRLRERLKSTGTPLPTKAAVLSTDLRSAVVDALRDDTEAFLRSLGRDVTTWRDFVTASSR